MVFSLLRSKLILMNVILKTAVAVICTLINVINSATVVYTSTF